MTTDTKQALIIGFMGTALLMAVASICYGTFAGKPIDVAAVQFAGTIAGAFSAILTSKQSDNSGGGISVQPPVTVTRTPPEDIPKPPES